MKISLKSIIATIIFLLGIFLKPQLTSPDILIWTNNNILPSLAQGGFVGHSIKTQPSPTSKPSFDQLQSFVQTYFRENRSISPPFTQQDIYEIFPHLRAQVSFPSTLPQDKKIAYLASIAYLQGFLWAHMSWYNQFLPYKIFFLDSPSSLRALSNEEKMFIYLDSISNNAEYREILTHEMGHVVDLGVLRGQNPQKSKIFTEFWEIKFSIDDPSILFYQISRRWEKLTLRGVTYKDFVSWYSLNDIFEDFAESFNFYLNHYESFKTLSKYSPILKSKFQYFKKLFDGEYIKSDILTAQYFEQNPNWRPWDTTKLQQKNK